ncbi:4'-phosphopantetheinyl transferase family protein [Shewanella waksmanii]|uniref:4'-phosphopantetheinyl transferase family protein n=1 Tax=Shewanella waksmanii TaxID=213783 RepID=UPI003735AB0D
MSVEHNKQHQAQLYFCPLVASALDTAQQAQLMALLPDDERRKINRLYRQEARDKALMVRGYLRILLSQYARLWQVEIAPNQWQFDYGDKGKPALSAADFRLTGIHFNISHSGEWLVISLFRSHATAGPLELGVDIERSRASTNIYAILSHYFTDSESQALLALPEISQRQRFFDLWALKESYIKAKGLGLAMSLKGFSFKMNKATTTPMTLFGERQTSKIDVDNGIELQLHDVDDDPQHWSILFGRLDDEYRFAISINLAQSPAWTAQLVSPQQVFDLAN